jgi:hypothetical protein
MLALGNIRVGQKDPWTRFTRDEQLTHMTLWSIAKSPLIFGGHLPKNDDWTLSLLTNDEVIAMNQHGESPRQIERADDAVVWMSGVPNSLDKYVAVFNTGELAQKPIRIELASIGLTGECVVRDLWAKREQPGAVTGTFTADVPSHGARLFRISPK